MANRQWGLIVKVNEVHDGDTIYGFVDQGLGIWNFGAAKNGIGLRILGISARELSMPGGIEVRDYLRSLYLVGELYAFESLKWDKYANRLDIAITVPGTSPPVSLADHMILEGWALPWNGKGTPPYPVWPRPQEAQNA